MNNHGPAILPFRHGQRIAGASPRLRVCISIYRALRAADRSVRFATLGLAGVLLVGMVLLQFGPEKMAARHVLVVLAWPAAALAIPIAVFWPLRLLIPVVLRRPVLAMSLLRCPGCWYDLSGVPAIGPGRTCPECGGAWRMADPPQSGDAPAQL